MLPETFDSLFRAGTFEDVYQHLHAFASEAVSDDSPVVFRHLRKNDSFVKLKMCSSLRTQIDAYLKKLFTFLQYEISATHSLILRAPDDLLVKLYTEPEVVDDAVKDLILQPLVHHNFNFRLHSIDMEIVPVINTKDVTPEHVNALGIALAKRGYLFWDSRLDDGTVKLDNVGLLPDGTPVILDPGAVCRVTNLHPDDKDLFDLWAGMPDPPYEWAGKQEQFFADRKAAFAGRVAAEDLGPRKRHVEYQEYPPSWGL